MAQVVELEFPKQQEAKLITGMYKGDKLAQYELYKYCANYYYEKYKGVFYASKEVAEEIFQDAFIKFWENIDSRKIFVEENLVKGKDGQPLNCSIRTYFMGIAKLKYLEWIREHPFYSNPETELEKDVRRYGFDDEEYMNTLYSDSNNIQLEIIADIIPTMPTRCYEILTKFYYENKDLDRILEEIPSMGSKNALKTRKHKCMENLREVANETYKRYLQY